MKSLDIEAEHSRQMKGMGGSYIILKYLLISYIQFSNSTRCQKKLAPGKNENIYSHVQSKSQQAMPSPQGGTRYWGGTS